MREHWIKPKNLLEPEKAHHCWIPEQEGNVMHRFSAVAHSPDKRVNSCLEKKEVM